MLRGKNRATGLVLESFENVVACGSAKQNKSVFKESRGGLFLGIGKLEID